MSKLTRSLPTKSDEVALRLAVPSDGELHNPALAFLQSCGLDVQRFSARRYTAKIGSLPGVQVLFQRAADIPSKVDEGSADLGIVGLDRFTESHRENGNANVIMEDLGFASADLVLAVPDTWIDVSSVADLADLAVEFRQSGRELRIATKYIGLVEQFLYRHGIYYFSIVESSGTLEAAPAMGFADIIADISETGVTLRENRLKLLSDGRVFSSQACLIGNTNTLAAQNGRLDLARSILERIEAKLRASGYYLITANIQGSDSDVVAREILKKPDLAGMRGPTIARTFSSDSNNWYAVTIVISRDRLQASVDHLRNIGGSNLTVTQPSYIFQDNCDSYERLVSMLS